MRFNINIVIFLLLVVEVYSSDKKVIISEINLSKELIDISKKIQENNRTLIYQIDNKKYYLNSLPKEYSSKSGKERFHFLKRYINYQLVLDSLVKEQQKYSNKIEKNIEKRFNLIRKKGNKIHPFNKALLLKKIAIDTILVEKLSAGNKKLDREVNAFYEKNKKLYIHPDLIEISTITSKNREELESIVTKLKKDKINIDRFSSFSSRYSSSIRLRKNGGYIGKISHISSDTKFFKTLWDSNISHGFLDKIIKINDFYTVVYIHQKEKEFTQTLVEEQDRIKDFLLSSEKKEWIKNRIRDIMKKRKVIIYDAFKK